MSFLTRFPRWNPIDELTNLRGELDRLNTQLFGEKDDLLTSPWAPATDVIDTPEAMVIRAEIPGMTEKDISIEMRDRMLTIRGERKFEKETKEKEFLRVERSYGKFVRSFTLPPNVDAEKIAATYEAGMLELSIPKKEEAKPKEIKVTPKKALSAAA